MKTYQQRLDDAVEDFMAWEESRRKEYLTEVTIKLCETVRPFDARDVDMVQHDDFQKLLKKLKPFLVMEKTLTLQIKELLIERLNSR